MTSQLRSERKAANGERGFTLVEILMVLGLVAILSVAGISVMTGSVDEDRYDATVAELRQIRAALVGDPELTQGGTRSSFGYLGDIGAIPTAAQGLAALQARPGTIPAFTINNAARFGVGWNGPYLATGASGAAFSFNDKWGRPYVYTPGATATIVSRGADGVAGGTGMNQDITMSIPPELQVATVYGFLSNGGTPVNTAFQAELNAPNGSGVIAQTLVSVAAGAQGAFQFTNVPLGPRSVTIYIPTRAAPTTTLGPISFVADRARFMIPTNLVDINPSGGGGPGPGGVGVCSANTGRILLDSMTPTSIGTAIIFRVDTTSAVNITATRVDTPADASLQNIIYDGRTYACAGGRNFTPCPAPDSTNFTLNSNAQINGNNRTIMLNFATSVNNVTSLTIDFTYTNGCDRLTLNGIL